MSARLSGSARSSRVRSPKHRDHNHADPRRHRRSHRQYAADQAQARLGADRLHHPGQGRVHEPGPVGQGPRRPPDDPRGGEARRAQAGRAGGRGHRRQHRHRPCARRQRARLPHADRHPGDAEPGKEGHAAAVRRRAGRGAGASPTAIPTTTSTSRGGWPSSCARARRNGVLFADQWNNLDNRKAHYVSTGPEIWRETDGKVDGFICSIGTGGTHRRRLHLSARAEARHRHRRRRSARRRDVRPVHARRGQGVRRRLDHRRHRARPRHADHRRTSRSTRPT